MKVTRLVEKVTAESSTEQEKQEARDMLKYGLVKVFFCFFHQLRRAHEIGKECGVGKGEEYESSALTVCVCACVIRSSGDTCSTVCTNKHLPPQRART